MSFITPKTRVDELYYPEYDRAIAWNDPDIGVNWQFDGEPILSEKDKHHPKLSESKITFEV